MLHIVTDGAGDLPDEWLKEFGIHVLPINIHFGEKTFLQYIDLDNDGFYNMVEQTRKVPKTSQPSPHQFVEFYKNIANAGDTILSIHVTSKLSGTFDSAVAASRELAGVFNIIPFDSGCGSAGLGMMCKEARLLERAGTTLDKIIARMEEIKAQIVIALTLETLEYARLSGRVGTLQAALASMLNVKPIVTLQEGMLQMTERVRKRSAALERILQIVKEKFGDQPLNMAVVHAHDKEAGYLLMEKVRLMFDIRELVMTDLSISVAANLGPGTVGLVAYPAEKG